MSSAALPLRENADRAGAVSTALWVFMGVASSLFALLVWAYVMRMSEADAVTLALPWQPWLASALLAAGSVALHRAARAGAGQRDLLVGALCALAFVAVQLWAWRAMLAAQVLPTSHPAASFFYLLTAMHGLHVLGGLAAWAWGARPAPTDRAAPDARWRIALLARYWHFLLVLWLLLFATLGLVTPELARVLCGVADAGGRP